MLLLFIITAASFRVTVRPGRALRPPRTVHQPETGLQVQPVSAGVHERGPGAGHRRGRHTQDGRGTSPMRGHRRVRGRQEQRLRRQLRVHKHRGEIADDGNSRHRSTARVTCDIIQQVIIVCRVL